MWSSARRVCTVWERKADLASTPAKHAIKEKWRSLRVCCRILSLAHPLQKPEIDGNTSEMLSTMQPCSPLAKGPASQLIGSKPTQRKIVTPVSRLRETPWQHTNLIPVSRTSSFSVLLAVKSSSVPGNAPTTTGFSSAPCFRSQLSQATSRRCMTASSRHWAQRKRKLPLWNQLQGRWFKTENNR